MADLFPFTQNPKGATVFLPVLDGLTCTAQIVWSIFGKRWYLRLFDPSGNLIVFTAVVGSSDFAAIETLAWDQLRGKMFLTTSAPHLLPIGSQGVFTVRGANPDAYNGTFLMTVEGPSTLSYKMTTDPGALVAAGAWGREVDLVAGYFTTSRLVFRESAQRFEVF